jgi:hypothetical protein
VIEAIALGAFAAVTTVVAVVLVGRWTPRD